MDPREPNPIFCPFCGESVPSDAPRAFCPSCLLGLFGADGPVGRRRSSNFRAGGGGSAGPAALFRLDDYELHGEIASGAMGTVYLARQISLNRAVAVKMIRSSTLATPAEIQMFKREAAVAATLDHPNIVPIYEIGEFQGRHYFSMKLIDGDNLAERISEFTASNSFAAASKSEVQARNVKLARLMACLAHAVQHAHERGVLHRDLKPTNILLDEEGEPHLTDFGLAKVADSSDGMHSRAILGTPAYMSPEQAMGKGRDVTTAADIYSLGAILYELLAGRPPFQGDSAAEILNQVKEREPEPLKKINPGVDRDLATIALKCLAKNPLARYPTALAIAEDLERFLRGEPIQARPVGPLEKLFRWCKRKPALTGLIGALCLALLGGLAGIFVQWQRAERNAHKESIQREHVEEGLFRLTFEKAETFFNQDRAEMGLAHLARLLREHPTNQIVAARIQSALSLRPFCLPIAAIRHSRRIMDVRLSPDGQRVLTAGFDGMIRITDFRTGSSVVAFHTEPLLRAMFVPNGSRVLTATQAGVAQLWDATTGQPIGPPMKHSAAIDALDISAVGDRVATGSRDKTARVWDALRGLPITAPLSTGGSVKSVAFAPDGNRLVSVCEPDGARFKTVHVWNLSSSELITVTTNQLSPATAAFTPDGKQLLVANAFFFDPGTGKALQTLPDIGDRTVLSAEFSSDGQALLTASADRVAQIWDWKTLQRLSPAMRHDNYVIDATFGNGGREVATGSRDATARVWDLNGHPLTEPMRAREPVWTVLLSADGTRVLTASHGEEAWIWEVRRQPPIPTFRHKLGLLWAAFSPDGERFVTTSQDRTAKLWDVATGRLVGEPLLHDGWINHAQFSPDGRYLVTGAQDGFARLWDLSTHTLTRTFPHRDHVRVAEFSPDGKRLATASFDNTAQIWDPFTGERIGKTLQHPARVHSVHFSPDGKRVVTAAQRGVVRVWETETGDPVTPEMPAPPTAVNARFTPDGRRVISASQDRTARVWDIATATQILAPVEHSDELALFSPDIATDGRRVLTAAGNTARLWDISTGRPLAEGFAHEGVVRSAWFSPDGRLVVTTSADKTARLWDATSGLPISEPLHHEDAVPNAFFASDGRSVVTISDDSTARLWEVSGIAGEIPDWLADLAEAVGGLRFDGERMLENVPMQAFPTLRKRLETLTGSDRWSAWARWFCTETNRSFWANFPTRPDQFGTD